MPVIHLPGKVSHPGLISALADDGALGEDWERTDLDFPGGCFIDQAAVALLCEWGILHRVRGAKIDFYGDDNVRRYLSRLDVFRHTEFPCAEHFERHPEAGRFIPTQLIASEQDVFEANNGICDLVLRQFDNARDFLPEQIKQGPGRYRLIVRPKDESGHITFQNVGYGTKNVEVTIRAGETLEKRVSFIKARKGSLAWTMLDNGCRSKAKIRIHKAGRKGHFNACGCQ